jgi:excisionase family DNA binding protein
MTTATKPKKPARTTMRVSEFAELAGVSRSTVINWVRAGVIDVPVFQPRKRMMLRFDRAAALKWLEEQRPK